MGKRTKYSNKSHPVPASAKMDKRKASTKPKSSVMKKKKTAKQSEKQMTPKARSITKPKEEDRNKPKKPPTAFFFFLEDFRKGYQEQNPDIKSMRDVGKACGEKWKTMTYEEKVKYYDIATAKRAEFDKAMAEYNRRKETGEDQDSYSDSEFDDY